MSSFVPSTHIGKLECCLSKAKNWEAIRRNLDRESNPLHHLNVYSTENRRVEKAKGPRSANF
jgi:hypothetical protein